MESDRRCPKQRPPPPPHKGAGSAPSARLHSASSAAERGAARSDLDLLVLDDAPDGGTLEHAVLEGGVILELRHRQLAAHAPGVEDEAIGIDHGIFVAEPFASGEPAVDLLQVV